ncbi:DUF3179 domain-containing protein [Haloferax sp. ATB1]|uniref:DUF3179 domain-containing protein n=1 Tax=Haloferax sp. ATB1 TaxID=1508454 RepID=UPI0005B21D13|nr:DUF3179 domain-containing protein [Haloferax sp. ATB1]
MHTQDVLPRDAIPSIDDPVFGTEYFGDDDDEVIVVETSPARAYPVRILSYHEIVNDTLGDDRGPGGKSNSSGDSTDGARPIAVTWCPICASAVVYDRRVDNRVLTFGTSGKLADDALVMYDRETESEWKQPLGRAIDGPLSGQELPVVPASMMSWQHFRAEYPDGIVLQPVHGGEGDPRGNSPRAVYKMTPYERYDAADGFGLREMRGEGRKRTWERNDIDPKTVVLGIVNDGDAVGYPVPQVQVAGGVVTDTVGNLDVLVVSTEGTIHAFVDPGYDFELRRGILYADGVSWETQTGQSDDGRTLSRVPARRLYAFAWQDDHGPESFYGLGEIH